MCGLGMLVCRVEAVQQFLGQIEGRGFGVCTRCLQSCGSLSDISFLAEGLLVAAAVGKASPALFLVNSLVPHDSVIWIFKLLQGCRFLKESVIIALSQSVLC